MTLILSAIVSIAISMTGGVFLATGDWIAAVACGLLGLLILYMGIVEDR